VSSKRDPFIDGLRSVSVLRVIVLHLLQRAEHPFVVLFSFAMPGMPLLFFVSGALAAKSLQRGGPEVRYRFWIARARRLLLPFWAFAAVVVTTCLVGQLLWSDAEHEFPLDRAWRWVLPLAGPQASPAYERLNWHLWFLSSLVLLLASAPWTVALHRRAPWVGACALFAAGALIESLAVPAPDVVRNTLLYGAVFQLGYGFADGRILRARTSTLIAAAVCLAAFALAFYAQRSPGAMLHATRLSVVTLGLAFVAVWLALRSHATRTFEKARPQRWIAAINRRAYTIYLWGPVANEIAWRAIQPASVGAYSLDFAIALVLLALLVRVMGPIEDWAARRGPKTARDFVAARPARKAA
jgi:peptidoglycan/LPS O-acetylase OafA/YrhL